MESPMLDNIGKTILNYAVFLAAVGTVVMALQEVIKNVFHARLWFNRREFYRWLGSDDKLRKEFMILTTGGYGSHKALFDQPIEKMMGQIQSAANMAMDFPDQYNHLYRFLTEIPATGGTDADSDTWGIFAAKKPAERAAATKDDANEAAKARARLGNIVARKLDAFQNQTQFAWSDWNQRISVLASSALIVVVLHEPLNTALGAWGSVLLILLALAGGSAAPFAKDVVSGLSQFGKGK